MIKKVFIYIVFLSFLSSGSFAFANDVIVAASIDKQSVQVDQEIHLVIRVTGAKGNIQAPRLPSYDGFDTYYTGRASHLTFLNGVSTSRVEFSYVLIPKTAGQFTLTPIPVLVGNQRFQTKAITIEVLGNQGQVVRKAPLPQAAKPQRTAGQPSPYVSPSSPRQEKAPAYMPQDDNIFIRATVDKTEVYPNEQVLLTYTLYTRYDTRYEGFAEEPEMSGFWIEEFPMERDIQKETVRINGKRYIKAVIRKIALFPTTPADYKIKPGSLKVSIRQEPQSSGIFDEFFNDSFFSGSGFFSRRESRVLKPTEIDLKVKSFPEHGKPENFQGAVGDFRMKASIDHERVKQNEPITMKLVIEGEGSIETLKQPELPELEEFKVYESDTSSQLFKSGHVIGGQKIFEIIFIPTQAGVKQLPELSFSFFNPQTKQYQTLKTPRFQIQADASEKAFELPKVLSQQDIFKKDIEVEGKDIHYIEERQAEVKNPWMSQSIWVLAIGNLILTLLVIVGLWKGRVENIFAKDTALRRRKLAKAHAETGIKSLKKLAKNPDDLTTYFDEVDRILTKYLSDKFNFSTHGSTRIDIERQLEASLGSQDSLFQSVLEVYRVCDESRFGRQEHPVELKEEAIGILRRTISRIEKVKK